MDKIKACFENKIVKAICWIVLAVVSAGLIIGGATTVDIGTGVALVAGIITAVSALIVFIAEKISNKGK